MNAFSIFLIPFTWHVIILFCYVAKVSSQLQVIPPNIACNEGVCFSQVLNDFDGLSIGLALPPLQSNDVGPDELLINLTTPTQYGYAALAIGDILIDQAVAGYMRSFVPPGDTPSILDYVVESVAVSFTSFDFPLDPVFPQSTFTISDSLSITGPNTISMVFRCQSCFGSVDSLATAEGLTLWTGFLSNNQPQYIDGGDTLADLSTVDSPSFAFEFNITTARFAAYDSFLQVAGLV